MSPDVEDSLHTGASQVAWSSDTVSLKSWSLAATLRPIPEVDARSWLVSRGVVPDEVLEVDERLECVRGLLGGEEWGLEEEEGIRLKIRFCRRMVSLREVRCEVERSVR